ncbi:MAG TPA: DNA gyrase inhibitor YacG [Nitrospirales bacterium]|nr:DNA gyrase inhibitor YacG [Nitrospirales bacterium]
MSATHRCPICRRETAWQDNRWRPFCSERCQLTDLGTWASEGYRIPDRSPFADEAEDADARPASEND